MNYALTLHIKYSRPTKIVLLDSIIIVAIIPAECLVFSCLLKKLLWKISE